MTKFDVPVGTVFGQRTTTSEKYKLGGRESHHYVDTICVCGKAGRVRLHRLHNGEASHCRDCVTRLPLNEVIVTMVYGSYAKSARVRGIAFELTREQFSEYIFKPCALCGTTPKNKMNYRRANGPVPRYTGLDRINNNLGYTLANIRPCCRWCNEAKKAKTEAEFRKWIEDLNNVNSRNRSQKV